MTFLPIKLDVTDEDLTSGITAEQMNTSIPVFVPSYYCINAKCSDEEKEAAEKFLVWLNTSETGMKYVITAEWPETAYSDIADFIVSSWSEAAGL